MMNCELAETPPTRSVFRSLIAPAAMVTAMALLFSGHTLAQENSVGAVYTSTNAADGNSVLTYSRAADGTLTGIRHAWTFDETFSAFATQGLAAKVKGKFTREELKPLAETNIESLKEYRYFTYARIDGKKQKDAFDDPVDYWLEFDPKKTELTLHLTMPFKHPVSAKQLVIEVFDPEFFVDFGFADDNPVKLANAPVNCSVSTEKPEDPSFTSTTKLGQLFSTSEANIGMGMNFANKISVECP